MEVIENKSQIKPKVLVADDDPPTRILLRAAISQWGFEVVEAKDGEEAWNILQQAEAPRLLILDWLMPKMDGIALCTRIKKESKLRPFIILLTRVTGSTNILKGLEAGADEFLSKPFNMAELRSRLSVGEKLINFEQIVSDNDQELLSYVEQSEVINQEIIEFSKKAEEYFKNMLLYQKENSTKEQMQETQELKTQLVYINHLITLLRSKRKVEGKN